MPREHDRTSFIAEIILESASGKRGARVSDVSEGGCYIDSIISVQVGNLIRFEIIHPNGGRLEFAGEVAYRLEGMGFGVKFTDLSDDQKLFLERITKQ